MVVVTEAQLRSLNLALAPEREVMRARSVCPDKSNK